MHLQVTTLVAVAAAATTAVAAKTMPICNKWKGSVYDDAKATYPDLKDAIEVVQEQGSVPWYSDNMDSASLQHVLTSLSDCTDDTKIPLVVYGIPGKDCDAGYSNAGSNKNFDDYKAYIGKLTKTFPTQNMLYIVEPDAVGLTADGGCAVEKEYTKYLKYVLETLSTNPNAEMYLDIGYWTLKTEEKKKALAKVVNEVWPAKGGVKGIALNTSNYQNATYMIELCEAFAKTTGKEDMKCIIDTSRNNKGPSAKGEWCNYKGAGIGVPPTMETGNKRAAYYLWVKPPGESDGTCDAQTSGDSLKGPAAGKFFKEHFEVLWKNGYFVEKGITKPGQGSSSSSEGSSAGSPSSPSSPSSSDSGSGSDGSAGSSASSPASSNPTPAPASPSTPGAAPKKGKTPKAPTPKTHKSKTPKKSSGSSPKKKKCNRRA